MKLTVMRRLMMLIALAAVLSACINPIPKPTPDRPSEPAFDRTPHPTLEPMPDRSLDTFGLIRDQVTPADRADEQLLVTADIPISDLRALAIKFNGLPPDTPEKTCAAAPTFNEGDQTTFIAFNSKTLKQFVVTATLIAKNDRAYMWLDDHWLTLIDHEALKRSTATFADKIYDRDHALFGLENSPGIDCDPRIHILNTSDTASGGYFWSIDQYTKAVRSDSNEKDMFYIDIPGVGGPQAVGSTYYDGVMAHEFQHLILYHQDRNEDTWVNEGMSELAIFLNGDDPGVDLIAAQTPDIQLNSWPEGGVVGAVNYGTAFSFMLYLWDRLGDAGVQALAAEPANGLSGAQRVLDKIQPGKQVDDFVADWLVARYLDDPTIDDGRYGYAKVDRAQVAPRETIRRYPFSERAGIHQYAGDYAAFRGDRDITIDFAGSTKARMINAEPHSGQYFWWSNRGDTTDLKLQREFDLTSVKNATLKYWTWYALEKDYDYGYLSVSDDGGQTWQLIQAPSSTDSNPVNSNYGWGYTGNSGGGDQPQWVQESVDLSEYAGKKISVAFEVVNDLGVNLPGMAIDDVEIPEINYTDGFENGDGGWQSAGWIRTNNFVPQKYVVQLISFGKDGSTTVTRLPIKDDNTAQWDVPLSQLDRAVVVVSAMAPKTTEVAAFNWSAVEK